MPEAVQRPRGTRDFAPAEMAVRRHVEAQMRSTFESFGYREVATPAFEELALFTAKSGEGIKSELYDFKDKGDRELCLRPELTAPVMRMYYEAHFNAPKPLKWYYFGPCYRYDRPQAGRYREFWQFGCELLGAGSPLAYAELLALADAVMRKVGLAQRDFFVGHVGILRRLVASLPFADASYRAAFMRLLDKGALDEMRADLAKHWTDGATAANRAQLDQFLSVIAAPTPAELPEEIAVFPEVRELEQVFAHLKALGVQNVRLNLGIARGLDYYTGIVFEMHCPILGAEKQLLGGGGYDLSAVFGGQPTPTMGFGLGFDRTIVALERQMELDADAPRFPAPAKPLVYLGALSAMAAQNLLPTVAELRNAGIGVELDLLDRKPGAIAKHADAVGARYLAIVGDKDLAAGTVQVKRLDNGEAATVRLPELAAHVRGLANA